MLINCRHQINRNAQLVVDVGDGDVLDSTSGYLKPDLYRPVLTMGVWGLVGVESMVSYHGLGCNHLMDATMQLFMVVSSCV